VSNHYDHKILFEFPKNNQIEIAKRRSLGGSTSRWTANTALITEFGCSTMLERDGKPKAKFNM
jgi:hypothetical protein